jgi:hypothetical protein
MSPQNFEGNLLLANLGHHVHGANEYATSTFDGGTESLILAATRQGDVLILVKGLFKSGASNAALRVLITAVKLGIVPASVAIVWWAGLVGA